MSTSIIQHDFNFAIKKPYCVWDPPNDFNVRTGAYYFNDGMIQIMAFKWNKKLKIKPEMSLFAIKNGRAYSRTIIGKHYTNTGLARKAGEFAKEIFNT